MPTKRAQVPQEPFAKQLSALEKLTGSAAPAEEAARSEDGNTVSRQYGEAATQHDDVAQVPAHVGKAGNEKISFYLRPDQVDKLDDLVLAFKKRTGVRLNRNELMRRLIDRTNLQLLLKEPQYNEDLGSE